MTLDGLETTLSRRFKPSTVAGQRVVSKVNLIRYADDFVITGATKDVLENEVRPLVEQFLHERGLQLSLEKTCITHVEQGFDFLGQHLRKIDGKLIVKPSRKNAHAFLEKVRRLVRANPATPQAQLIGILNPVIRGWTNDHRHVVAWKAFIRMDHQIWQALWRWAKRRHPNKNGRWIKARYWTSIGTRSWTFAVDRGERTAEGKPIWMKLAQASDTKIRRHVKIRGRSNPFDPRWRSYFEDRAFFKKMGIHRHEAGINPSC